MKPGKYIPFHGSSTEQPSKKNIHDIRGSTGKACSAASSACSCSTSPSRVTSSLSSPGACGIAWYNARGDEVGDIMVERDKAASNDWDHQTVNK